MQKSLHQCLFFWLCSLSVNSQWMRKVYPSLLMHAPLFRKCVLKHASQAFVMSQRVADTSPKLVTSRDNLFPFLHVSINRCCAPKQRNTTAEACCAMPGTKARCVETLATTTATWSSGCQRQQRWSPPSVWPAMTQEPWTALPTWASGTLWKVSYSQRLMIDLPMI